MWRFPEAGFSPFGIFPSLSKTLWIAGSLHREGRVSVPGSPPAGVTEEQDFRLPEVGIFPAFQRSCGSLGPFTEKDDEAQTPRSGREAAFCGWLGPFTEKDDEAQTPHRIHREARFSTAGVAGERDCPPPGLRERNFRPRGKKRVSVSHRNFPWGRIIDFGNSSLRAAGFPPPESPRSGIFDRRVCEVTGAGSGFFHCPRGQAQGLRVTPFYIVPHGWQGF